MTVRWGEKRYYSLDYYLKTTYGEKLYKISLDGGMTCPNRDGTLGTRGCIFCSRGGSGDFAESHTLSVTEQIESGKKQSAKKYTGSSYIAYFQAYTNTYASLAYLEKLYMEAILHPDIRILSIATRPDCLGNQVIDMLRDIQRIKPVWVELGLQTIHEETAKFINRGYPISVYDEAVKKLRNLGVHVIVHMILGLPGETQRDMIETAEYIGKSGAQGIKLQLLHVLKGTNLAELYQNGECSVLSLEDYTECVVSCLKVLPPDMVIHRLTGDGPKKLLIAPLWSADKKKVMNTINAAVRQA